MPIFRWYNKFSLNNELIDNQHKKLFDIVNNLFDTCVGDDKDKLSATVVDELLFYSDYHFKTEEQYMRDIGYDDIDRHIKLHDTFRQKLTEFKQNKLLGEHDLCHELLIYLSKWLMHHVMEEDKKIGHKS